MKDFEKILERYYEGSTSAEEDQQLIEYLTSSNISEKHFSYKKEFDLIKRFQQKTFPIEEIPSLILDESEKKDSLYLNWWKLSSGIAASLVLLLAGYLGGNIFPLIEKNNNVEELENDVQQLKVTTALILLDQPSASERLKGLNYVNELTNSTDKIEEALLNTLNFDPNENVRLAAVSHLVKFKADDKLPERLTESFNNEKSPFVQLEIIDALIQLLDQEHLLKIKKRLNRDQVDEVVIEKLTSL
jgi:hypothetical protein